MKLPHMNGFGKPSGGKSVSKIGHVSTNQTVAQTTAPADQTGHTEHRTQVSTYFTKAPQVGVAPEILYNGDRMWARVILTLETAGPVCVGQQVTITPVLSGKGQLLQTGIPTPFVIAKGTKLYIAATAANRVTVVLEPIPWLETITGLIGTLISKISGVPAVQALTSKL